jgi:hypothetical protein
MILPEPVSDFAPFVLPVGLDGPLDTAAWGAVCASLAPHFFEKRN